jgi:hypothetical protein
MARKRGRNVTAGQRVRAAWRSAKSGRLRRAAKALRRGRINPWRGATLERASVDRASSWVAIKRYPYSVTGLARAYRDAEKLRRKGYRVRIKMRGRR